MLPTSIARQISQQAPFYLFTKPTVRPVPGQSLLHLATGRLHFSQSLLVFEPITRQYSVKPRFTIDSRLQDIHIPARFQKLLRNSSDADEKQGKKSSDFKIVKSLGSSKSRTDVPRLHISQKRLLHNIQAGLEDILANDTLPRQLLHSITILSTEYTPNLKKCIVRWRPESWLPGSTEKRTSDQELSMLLEKYSILFRELISNRLGFGVCSPKIPPLVFKLDKSDLIISQVEEQLKQIEIEFQENESKEKKTV